MSDQELHTLTGAYATDALDADERGAFEQHLESCGSCRLEVAELRATAARLAVATSSSDAAMPTGWRTQCRAWRRSVRLVTTGDSCRVRATSASTRARIAAGAGADTAAPRRAVVATSSATS